MFYFCKTFNQPLDQWNISSVIDLEQMFGQTAQNQDLSSWDVAKVTECDSFGNMGCNPSKLFTDQCVETCCPTEVANSNYNETGVISGLGLGEYIEVECVTNYAGGGKAMCGADGLINDTDATCHGITVNTRYVLYTSRYHTL